MLRLLALVLLCHLGLSAQVTVVLLRHAEKASSRLNAELSPAGRSRAQQLAPELAAFTPVALYASELRRTQQTLEPLSQRLGLSVRIRDRSNPRGLAVEILGEFKSGTVVVCAHSDTVADIAHALGYPDWLPEPTGFDRLWILRIGPDGFKDLETRRQQAKSR